MNSKILRDRVKIIDSYKIRKRSEMKKELLELKKVNPNCQLFISRNLYNLTCEWKVHNRLYYLGILRSRTKDVDLNYNLELYWKILYFIFGI